MSCLFFFFQAEDGIRDLVRSRGLGDVYKRQMLHCGKIAIPPVAPTGSRSKSMTARLREIPYNYTCLLYTSDAADDLV